MKKEAKNWLEEPLDATITEWLRTRMTETSVVNHWLRDEGCNSVSLKGYVGKLSDFWETAELVERLQVGRANTIIILSWIELTT